MANKYVAVKSIDLTSDMQNRAVQPFKNIVVSLPIAAVPTDHNLIEIEPDKIILTDIFDGYTWYDADDARYMKDNGDWPA